LFLGFSLVPNRHLADAVLIRMDLEGIMIKRYNLYWFTPLFLFLFLIFFMRVLSCAYSTQATSQRTPQHVVSPSEVIKLD